MYTVQWRHTAEVLACLFKKERLKRGSNQPLTNPVVMLGDWDMRKPSLVSVSAPRYSYDLRQMKELLYKVLHLVNGDKSTS